MSASIDERIVSMKFDNRQFQTGVSDSLNSINKLKQGLNFQGSTKGLDAIGASASRVNFEGMSNGLDTVRVKFSALQVAAVTALANITNSALEAGKNIISALTIDPIMEGFREYETQMNSIQTVLANTADKGTTLDDVKKSLSELNTYSDKTIYNFSEMTRNIGTFTAAGVDLKTSTAAIKGIANLAAISGSNSQQASTAMYQLSQALAAGKVSLMDWNSVVNAGMGGAVFQKSLMETARVHGVAIDQMVKSEGSFRNTLEKGWLTSDILTETLSKFTGDLNASQLKTMGYTEEQIAGIIKMGQTANDAATKVKTITQLFETLKEAVGSGWAQTWQTVFGDFEEAKVLFTNVSNVLGGMIGKTSEARNEMLKGWKDLGGRTALIDAVKNAFDGVMNVVEQVGGAFREVFPATTSQQLYNFTVGLRDLIDRLRLSDSQAYNLGSTFKGIFAILDIGKTILFAVGNAINIMMGGSGNLVSSILAATGAFGEWLTALDNTIKSSGVINTVFTALAKNIRNVFSGTGDTLMYFGAKFIEVRDAILKEIKFDPWVSFGNVLSNIGKTVGMISEKISELQDKLSNMLTSFGQKFNGVDIGGAVTNIYKSLSSLLVDEGDEVKKANEGMQSSFTTDMNNFIRNIGGISLAGIGFALSKMILTFTESFRKKGDIKSIFDGLKDAISGGMEQITGTLDSVRGALKSYQDQLKAGILLKIATAIAILAASIVAISLIDSGKLATSLAAIGGLFAQLLIATKIFSLIGDYKASVIKSSIVMMSMSTSILILANAMRIIGQLDIKQTITALSSVLALMGMMTLVTKVLSKDSGTFVKGALSILAFAEAIKMLAQACISLSSLNPEQLKKGLIGIGVVMTELSLFLNKTNPALGLKTAFSILILSAALNNMYYAVKNIGSLDWENVKKGLLGIGGVLAEVAIFDKYTTNTKNVIATSVSLGIISVAMNNMGKALSGIGSLDWETIKKGLIGMGGVLLEVALFDRFTSNIKNVAMTSASLVIVALALQKMCVPLREIGSLDWQNIKKGLIGMGGALLEISMFNKLSSGLKGTITSTISLGIAVSALSTLAKSLELFGTLSWGEITKGLVGMGGALTEIVIMMNMLSKNTPVNSLALIGIATALNILTKAFVGLSGLSWEGVAKGIVAISAALMAISIAMKLIPGDSIFTALGLTGVATALVTMSQAMIPLSNLSWNGVAKGIVAIGGSLVVLAGGIKLMEGSLSGVMALILAATALNLLVPPILQLSAISWEGMLKSLVTLAGVFAVLGIAASLLTPVIPAMYALSGALIVLGLAVVAIGAGVALAAAGFDKLTASFNTLDGTTQQGAANISSSMTAMVQGIANGIPMLVAKIGEGISTILQYLINSIPLLCDFVLKAIVAMTESIAKNAPLIFNNVMKTLDSILDVLIKWIPTISKKVVDIVLMLLKILNDNIGKFTKAAVDIIVGFVNGISNSMSKIVDSALNLVLTFLNELANAIRNNSATISEVCYNLVTAIVDAIGNLGSKFVDAGIYAVEGFIKGLGSLGGKLWDAGASLGNRALNAAKKALDEHSPSKAFFKVGSYATEGFVNGLTSLNDVVSDTSANMGNTAINSMSKAISGISDIVNGNIDSQPVIRPVLDLTDIQNGTSKLYSMVNGVDGYSLNGSVSTVTSVARSIRSKQISDNISSSAVGNNTTVTNVQTPKQPVTLQLMLQNGRVIAEYIIDDVDSLIGAKNKITGRMVGV